MEEENNLNLGRVNINSNTPEILTNNIYTPAFLRTQIGKLMRVEFLIGTNNLTDRVGVLEEVGASYILLRSVESNLTTFADIYAIKFITISNGFFPMNNNFTYTNNMQNPNTNFMYGSGMMNNNFTNNMNSSFQTQSSFGTNMSECNM